MRQVRVFAERGERFEWKLHGHDRPDDLSQRLLAAGFVPEETETIVIAPVADIAGEVRLPDGVSLREATSRVDFERIAALEQAIWGDEGQQSWLVDMLESERAVDPDALTIMAAEAGPTVVCAAWIRFEHGTEFATLWGGATLPRWRRRGIIAPSSRTGRTSPPRAASATSRRTPRTTPPHPRASRLHRGDDDQAIRLVAPDDSGSRAVACASVENVSRAPSFRPRFKPTLSAAVP
jgi:hypothetical protein